MGAGGSVPVTSGGSWRSVPRRPFPLSTTCAVRWSTGRRWTVPAAIKEPSSDSASDPVNSALSSRIGASASSKSTDCCRNDAVEGALSAVVSARFTGVPLDDCSVAAVASVSKGFGLPLVFRVFLGSVWRRTVPFLLFELSSTCSARRTLLSAGKFLDSMTARLAAGQAT